MKYNDICDCLDATVEEYRNELSTRDLLATMNEPVHNGQALVSSIQIKDETWSTFSVVILPKNPYDPYDDECVAMCTLLPTKTENPDDKILTLPVMHTASALHDTMEAFITSSLERSAALA